MKHQENKKYSFSNYLIIFFSILTVSPFFDRVSRTIYFLFLIFLIFESIRRHKRIIEPKIIMLLFFVYMLILIQSFLYRRISYAAIYTPILIFYIPYLVFKLMGLSFYKYFAKTIFIITIITLPLWLLQSTVSSIDQSFKLASYWAFEKGWASNPRALLIYTSAWSDRIFNDRWGVYRNSGLFHEPGAYAIMLNLGILIYSNITGNIFNKKNLILIFSLLTTFSTTGYIALFFIFIIKIVKTRLHILIKVILFILFLIISINVYKTESFLERKIEYQFESQMLAFQKNYGTKIAQSGRFFAFFTSLKIFLKNPFFGRGIIYATSEKATGEMHEGASYTYGLMGMLSRYGIFFGIFFIYYFYKGIKIVFQNGNYTKTDILLIFLIINAMLSTQVYITTVFFMCFFIIGLFNNESSSNKFNSYSLYS